MKVYDRNYFERWYRHPRHRVTTREGLTRKVRMAVSITEFLINRPIRSVLDVGCGEAPWFPILRRMRPGVRYVGVDSSEYAIERYGATRNIRYGTLASLSTMKSLRVSDLVVCADVLSMSTRLKQNAGSARFAGWSAAPPTSKPSRLKTPWPAITMDASNARQLNTGGCSGAPDSRSAGRTASPISMILIV